MKTTDDPIVVSQVFALPVEKVWQAITEVNHMRKWFFEQIESFQPVDGFMTQFAVGVEDRTFTHLWKIVEVIPNQLIKYSWRYAEYPGDSFVSFKLTPSGNTTLLTVSTEVISDFPDEVPEFRKESCVGGWEYFVQQSLKNYLSGDQE